MIELGGSVSFITFEFKSIFVMSYENRDHVDSKSESQLAEYIACLSASVDS